MPEVVCNVCDKVCKTNQISIFCDICHNWLHLKCTKLSVKSFQNLGPSSMPYFCQRCLNFTFPFSDLNNVEMINVTENKRFGKHIFNNTRSDGEGDECYCSPEELDNGIESINDLKLLHANVRSLCKNLNKIHEIIHLMKKTPEIIAISETKLKDNYQYTPIINQYTFECKNSKSNAGGVGIFIKSGLSYKIIKYLTTI